jgi:PEGA domain
MMKRPATCGAALLLWIVALPSPRAEDVRRSLAVLEYRSGSSAMAGLATRLATEIGRLTDFRVSSPDQARAIFGAALDSQVARCGGDGECLADLGYRLGVNEVVLVGVGEFGDAVMTLQRIDVETRRVEARIAESMERGKVPSDAELGGYLTRLFPPKVFLRFGIIDVVANGTGATVLLSGEHRGQTPLAPLKVRAPASYELRVEKTGFVPFSATVQVPPDGAVKVSAQLMRKPAATAWYQHPWVLAVAATAVATAAGTALYFATRDDGSLTIGGEIK